MKLIVILLLAGLLNIFLFVIVHRGLVLHVVALRQQLTVFKSGQPRPRLRDRDRLFWVVISRVWPNWRSALIIVKPETVIRWQKKRFREFWRMRSRPGPGRPRIPKAHIDFIRRISMDHRSYGKAKIALELKIKFGVAHSPTTIGKYMVKTRGVSIPYGAPNAQAHIERLIGTLRRECLDRMLIWNERHLRAVLGETADWYNPTVQSVARSPGHPWDSTTRPQTPATADQREARLDARLERTSSRLPAGCIAGGDNRNRYPMNGVVRPHRGDRSSALLS